MLVRGDWRSVAAMLVGSDEFFALATVEDLARRLERPLDLHRGA